MLFNQNDIVQAKIIHNFSLKCQVLDSFTENGKKVYWLISLENKGRFIENERLIATENDLTLRASSDILNFDF